MSKGKYARIRRSCLHLLVTTLCFLWSFSSKSQTIYGITGGSGVGYLTEITIVNGQCSVSTVAPLIDIATGLPILFHNLAICPDGILYAQGAGYLYTIDPTNGLCTPLFPTNVFNINGLVCSPDNVLYGVSQSPLPHSLIELDPTTSTSSNLGPLNFWSGGDLVFFNDQLYCVSDDGLFIINIGNPLGSSFVFHCGIYPALTVLPGYCNSLLGSDLDGQFFQINPDTQEETLICSPGQYMFDFASLAEFDPATQCPFIIDLDDDNSSGADEYDFNGPVYNCNSSDGIPICDQDVKIMSDIKILSITISLEDGILDGLAEYLKFEGNVPFISVTGSGSQSITLTNTGNASVSSFENALRSILYYNDADPLTPGQRTIKVVGVNLLGTSSNDAFAYLEVQELTKLDIDLGPDTTLCKGITYLLDAYYPGASYQWNTGETTSFTFVTEPGIYAVTVSHPNRCPGFDEVEIDFLPSKFTTLELPASVCAGDSIDIKINSQLSQPFDIVMQSSTGASWSYTGIISGHHFKIKANQNQLIHIANITTEETQCALSELATYPIKVFPRDTTRFIYSFCEGDSVFVSNQWHFTNDTLEQKLKNKMGCDSLVFFLLKRIDKDTLFTQQYTCNAAEAGTTFSNSQSAEGCLLVNQTETILLLPDTTLIHSTTCVFTEAGTFQSNYINSAGCDSIVIESRMYQNNLTTHIHQTTCTLQDTATLIFYLTSNGGCDSTVIVDKQFKPADTTAITSYTCNPADAGIKITVLSNQFGCDSTLVETINLLLSDTTSIQKYTCNANEAGISTYTYQNLYGCDSLVIEEKIWVKADTTERVEYTCLQSSAGLDTLSLKSQYGCDSIVIYKKIYQPQDTMQSTKITCDATETGIFIQHGISSSGCDSIHKLVVLFSPPDTTYVTRYSCHINEAGVFESTLVNHSGCDSFTREIVLYLPPDTTHLTQTTCIQTETGEFKSTYSNVYGCDSIVITQVNLLKSDTVYEQKFACNAQEAGLFTHYFTNQYGCDSIIYEDIKWAGSDTLFMTENRCHISADTTFIISLSNQWGCDSIVRVQWIARSDDYTTMSDTVCLLQDTTTTFLHLKNKYGCDSIVNQKHIYIRDLTVLPVIFTCDSIAEDSIYYYLTNSTGCDSVVVQPYLRKPEDQCRKAYNLILPNIIDPDINGQSNFHISTHEKLYILDFRIYDRWGNLIYHSTNEEIQDHKGWDGSFNGIPVVQGVYVYYIKLRWDGNEFSYTGDVTVVR